MAPRPPVVISASPGNQQHPSVEHRYKPTTEIVIVKRISRFGAIMSSPYPAGVPDSLHSTGAFSSPLARQKDDNTLKRAYSDAFLAEGVGTPQAASPADACPVFGATAGEGVGLPGGVSARH